MACGIGASSPLTFCIQYRNSVPGLEKAVPFVTAIVQLEEGPRLMTFLIGIEPDPKVISCDMEVELGFLDLESGHSLPVFRPARSS